MMKLGMTCEGGANRTIFSCGVLDAFLEEDLLPDYFIGVSAGIAYGVSYLSKQKGRNLKLMEQFMADKRYMGMRHLINRKTRAYYNIPFVFEEIPDKLLPFDYDALAAFPGEIEAAVTNIHTGKAAYVPVPRDKSMEDVLVASCSLPILFQPVKIGKHYYLDGGLADSVPFEHAMKKGCDKNIVVLTRAHGYVKKTDRVTKMTEKLYKKYPKIVESLDTRAERYNACMKKLYELEKEGKVFIIAPDDTYGVGRTETDTKLLGKLYQEGYDIAKREMPKLKEYLKG